MASVTACTWSKWELLAWASKHGTVFVAVVKKAAQAREGAWVQSHRHAQIDTTYLLQRRRKRKPQQLRLVPIPPDIFPSFFSAVHGGDSEATKRFDIFSLWERSLRCSLASVDLTVRCLATVTALSATLLGQVLETVIGNGGRPPKKLTGSWTI